MALTLTSEEVGRLEESLVLLLSPLEHASSVSWRQAVCRSVSELVGADGAATTIKGTAGPEVLGSETFSRRALADYAEHYHRRSEIDQRRLRHGLRTWVRSRTFDPSEFSRSNYFNEWCRPNRVIDSAGMSVVCPDRFGAEAVLHVTSETTDFFEPEGRQELLLRLLRPAFAAGVAALHLSVAWHASLESIIDDVDGCLALHDLSGKLLHATLRLRDLVQSDPEGPRVMAHASRLASATGALARRRWSRDPCRGVARQERAKPVQSCQTLKANYMLRAILVDSGKIVGVGPLVLVNVDAPTQQQLPDLRTLCACTGLTPREAAVARLLAEGLRNRGIAQRLTMSEFTARRHTEQILRKLGVESRAQVGAALRAIPR